MVKFVVKTVIQTKTGETIERLFGPYESHCDADCKAYEIRKMLNDLGFNPMSTWGDDVGDYDVYAKELYTI